MPRARAGFAGGVRAARPAAPTGTVGRTGRPAHALVDLQRQAGNAAVRDLLASGGWSRRLPVSRQTPGDLDLSRPPGAGGPTIAPDLLRTVDLRALSDADLTARYDAAAATLGRFRACPADPGHPYWTLSTELGRAGTELARRRALAAGRTFTDAEMASVRRTFEDNAAKPKGGGRKECIVILNKVLQDLWQDPGQKHTNETIEKTMALFEAGGRAGPAREIWFTTRRGRVTRGGARPEGLQANVWQAAVDMAAGDPGWSMFGMSLMDGFHALTLTLDNNDPAKPTVLLSDQVPGWTDGWKEYGRAELDAHVLDLVQGWWDDMPAGRKHTTVVRLWRLRRKPAAAAP